MKTKSVSQTLTEVKSKYRKQILDIYDSQVPKVEKEVFGKKSMTRTLLNDTLRSILSEAIFAIENEVEHRMRKCDRRNAALMRRARNNLYDDLGWNETWRK